MADGDGSFFTRKVGPLPLWGWVAVALVGWYLYKKYSSGSTSSVLSGTTSSTSVPTETLTTPGGSYSGPVGQAPPSVTNPSPGNPSGPATSPGSTGTAAFTPPTNAQLVGSGYLESSGPGSQGNSITDAAGNQYLYVSSPAQLSVLVPQGNTYVQTAPGVFTQENLASPSWGSTQAPIYQRTGTAPATTGS
jgi:hypothetical protein